ncbi:hypothetical protein SPRG_17317 [Saprolegnia parasitica CBS 223.65]|uniref:Uncharacterized protein n=1 Tax=Saprolegnia parasitica (strain CBS 223.65) TaxID=695850 RepID=A0A067BFV4_SAPPC|nr:hypothetical protein SPRG_17317 [Saprolegnia parasitica CBS 223.65]KDO17249.1 hypothetical protein SPRG_17317 [Saprolegnia parasitica CBS 223.65]|eukprot:XP_012212042.1 hypothetical protein SPRG_17317 [Saprolegnia parasitica CBS 223.65]
MLAWSQERRREYEDRLDSARGRRGTYRDERRRDQDRPRVSAREPDYSDERHYRAAMKHESRSSPRSKSVHVDFHASRPHEHRWDDHGAPRTSNKHISGIASFHEDEYVGYLQERREMKASRPPDRGKWKCMGTTFMADAEHSCLYLPSNDRVVVERQFWTWAGREVILDKVVSSETPIESRADDDERLPAYDLAPHQHLMGHDPWKDMKPLQMPPSARDGAKDRPVPEATPMPADKPKAEVDEKASSAKPANESCAADVAPPKASSEPAPPKDDATRAATEPPPEAFLSDDPSDKTKTAV